MTKFLFNHVPKTAGTSLRVWLEEFFRPEEVFPGFHFEAETGVPDGEWGRYRLFAAHHAWRAAGEVGSDDGAVRITWLREPEALIRSVYRYQVEQLDVPRAEAAIPRIEGYPDYVAKLRDGMGFEEFLLKAASQGVGFQSYQCRWLSARSGAMMAWFRVPSNLLPGARAELDRCLMVGVVERFQDSVDVLCHRMKWPPLRFGIALNRSASDSVVASEAAWGAFREGNEDFGLYGYADGLLTKAVAGMRAELGVTDGGTEELHRRLHEQFLKEGDEALVGRMRAAGEVLYGEGWGPRKMGAEPERLMLRWMGSAGTADAFLPVETGGAEELTFRVVRNRGFGILRTLTVAVDGVAVELTMTPDGSESYPQAVRFTGRIPEVTVSGRRFREVRLAVAEESRAAALGAAGDSAETRTMLATDGIFFR